MYRALITDLDGTAINITSDGREITAHTRATVAQAVNRGFKLACATGREWDLAGSVVKRLGFTSPCIIDGGTRIIDPVSEKTLWEKHLQGGVSQEILAIFKQLAKTGLLMHSANVSKQPLESIATIPHDLRFMYLLAINEPTSTAIINQVNAGSNAVAHMTPSWFGQGLFDVHVTHPEGTKEYAMHVWQHMEGVTQAETIGMGDSGNDVPIFQAAGLKVAVGNATPELKALADYIAPTASEGALEHVIKKFLLADAKSKSRVP